MKNFNPFTTALLCICMMLSFSMALAQNNKPRESPGASVTQRIGSDTDITINYSRPKVKGRKIWGDVVPYGMSPGNKWSKDKPYPWRAGANENTTIEISEDVLVEGKKLPAGKYGIHMIPSEKEWVVIFSKNNSSWGSFSYKQEEDALRVTVTPVKAEHQEWLTYGFDDPTESSATAFLHWEKLKVPFKIQIAN